MACVVATAVVFAPVGARAKTTSCNIPEPCAVFANNNGIALDGESAGVAGVLGTASRRYGVVAYGSLYGVYGQAGNTGLSSTGPGYGVFGQDNAGSYNED